MRIASWNVNSVRSRLDQLTAWLAQAEPDVLCMQETKVEDPLFPHDALAAAGYNGVAIAARRGLVIEDVQKGFHDDAADAQARVLAATVGGVRVVDVYVPNG